MSGAISGKTDDFVSRPVSSGDAPPPGTSDSSIPPAVRCGLVGNAVVASLATVSLPIMLSQHGASKVFIAVYFVTGAVGGAVLTFTAGRLLLRAETPRPAVLLASVCAIAGVSASIAVHPMWPLYIAAVAVMCNSLGYPRLVAAAPNDDGRQLATVRQLFVFGYLVGLGLFAALSGLAPGRGAALPAAAAAVVAALNGALAFLPTSRRVATPGRRTATGAGAGPAMPAAAVITACIAVLLMRSADSLRQVYLPLYALADGVRSALVSTLFAVTAVGELFVLAPLGRLSDRHGSSRVLVGVAAAGAASSLIVWLAHGYLPLITSQVLYAVFAAGFQSIGMVLLADLLPSGVGGGAVAYMALVQLGSTLGIVAPLAVPGYAPALFALGALFCVVAMLLLVPPLRAETARRMRDARNS